MIDLRKLTLEIPLLRSGYRSGDFTPAEVVREIYRRIGDRGNDHVWLHLRPEDEAVALAAGIADRLHLPLAGIPCAIKDNIDVAGMPTTAACPAFAFTPEVSATCIRLLEEAGAIILGKTNMDQFATGLVGTRSPHGACASVYHPEFISGGSSSGSAVAVAAGVASFALGTDTAGSGRVPAAFNNLVGLKPSRGAISTTGVVPACRSLDCVSILAREVEDATLVLDILTEPDVEDPYSRLFEDRVPFSRPFRFGVPGPGQLDFLGDTAAAALYDQAVARFVEMGGIPIETDISPFLETAVLLYGGPWVAERYSAVGKFIDAHPSETDPTVAGIIASGAGISASDAFSAIYELESLRKRSGAAWHHIDFLLLPTTPTTYRIDEVLADPVTLNSNLGRYTNFVNLLDLAALALPAGFRPDGVPLGVTIMAPAFSDFELCEVGRRFLGKSDSARRRHRTLENAGGRVELAVVGAHLTGYPLNHQLVDLGGAYVQTIETAPDYALYALKGFNPPRPGLVCAGENKGVRIETEIWSLTERAFGKFVQSVPPPMTIGSVRLKDGRRVKGFLCEEFATHGAEAISAHGGWRNYLNFTELEKASAGSLL